jgi:hypothetical protein
MTHAKKIALIMILTLLAASSASAGTQGHYYPGVMGMRDIIVPPKGFYMLFYDPFYFSSDYRDANGRSMGSFSGSSSETKYISVRGRQVPVEFSASVSGNVETSMTFIMQNLLMVWVPGWKVIGADFAMMLVPSAGYVSIDAKVTAHASGTVRIGEFSKTVSKDETVKISSSKYGFGDLLVQPVMLDWRGRYGELGFNYGFYAPTGAYDHSRIANVGMGFWTQQFQAWGAYYFDDHRTTAATLVATYDFNSSIYDQDLAPGQSMTLEYGVDHYFNERLSLGVYGYDQWQISADTGAAAKNTGIFYQVHGIGGQISGWLIKNRLNVTGKCIYEYYAVDRFRGILSTVNVIWVW